MGDFRAFACYCSDSLLERNDSAAIGGGSHTNNFPALRVHLVRLVFNELGTLNETWSAEGGSGAETAALSFTVKSLRLDAVTAALFGLSRTTAAEQIRMGLVSLNYAVCEKADAPVQEGDVLSLRGHGKGSVTALGGRSKKDRLFVEAEIYL